MVEIKPRLRIGSPGMLRRQREPVQKPKILLIAGRHLPTLHPFSPQPDQFAIAREFRGITGSPMNPGITNLLCNHGNVPLVGLHSIGNLSQICSLNRRAREPCMKTSIDLANLFQRVRAGVVISYLNCNREIRTWNLNHASVIRAMVHHIYSSPVHVAPDKQIRDVRGRAGRIHSNI